MLKRNFLTIIAALAVLSALHMFGCQGARNFDSQMAVSDPAPSEPELQWDMGRFKEMSPTASELMLVEPEMDGDYNLGYNAVEIPEPAAEAPLPSATQASLAGALKVDNWFSPKAYADETLIDEKYLIRNGNLTATVKDYDEAYVKVTGVAARFSGIVTDSQQSTNHQGRRSGWIKLRIPNENFFEAWEELRQIGDTEQQSINSEDVSRQYVSQVSSLKNLMLEQETLRQMLADAVEIQKTHGLKEGHEMVLEVQKRLFQVNGQIQTKEDQISQLADRITRSTIVVTLSETPPEVTPVKTAFTWGFGNTIGRAKDQVTFQLKNIANGVLWFLMTAWIWMIPWIVVIWIAFKALKRWVLPLMKPSPVLATGEAAGWKGKE